MSELGREGGRDGRNREEADTGISTLPEFQHCRILSLSLAALVFSLPVRQKEEEIKEEDKCDRNPLADERRGYPSFSLSPAQASEALVSRPAIHWEYLCVCMVGAACVAVDANSHISGISRCKWKTFSTADSVSFNSFCFCNHGMHPSRATWCSLVSEVFQLSLRNASPHMSAWFPVHVQLALIDWHLLFLVTMNVYICDSQLWKPVLLYVSVTAVCCGRMLSSPSLFTTKDFSVMQFPACYAALLYRISVAAAYSVNHRQQDWLATRDTAASRHPLQ